MFENHSSTSKPRDLVEWCASEESLYIMGSNEGLAKNLLGLEKKNVSCKTTMEWCGYNYVWKFSDFHVERPSPQFSCETWETPVWPTRFFVNLIVWNAAWQCWWNVPFSFRFPGSESVLCEETGSLGFLSGRAHFAPHLNYGYCWLPSILHR